MDPTLGTNLSVDNQAIFIFLCAFAALTRLSVTAADGGTLDTVFELERNRHLASLDQENRCGTFTFIKENMLREMQREVI